MQADVDAALQGLARLDPPERAVQLGKRLLAGANPGARARGARLAGALRRRGLFLLPLLIENLRDLLASLEALPR